MSALIAALSTPRPRPRKNVMASIAFSTTWPQASVLGHPRGHGIADLPAQRFVPASAAVVQPALVPHVRQAATKAHNHH